MEDCQTPTLSQVMEFKYEVTPTMVFDPSRLQEAQNLSVNLINVRCFTPTMKNFQSPGLSPINEGTQMLVGGVAVGALATVKEEYFKAPMKPKSAHTKQTQTQTLQQQQHQQHCQQQIYEKNIYSAHFVSDSPPVFTLNSTTISDTDVAIGIASPDSSVVLGSINNNNNSFNSSNFSNNATFTNSNNNAGNVSKNLSNTNLLDRTMNVSTLLRSVGLEQYTEMFEGQDLYLEQFLNIGAEDLQRLGVHNAEHQRKLLDLLSELNGN